jgi:hypothetical protein
MSFESPLPPYNAGDPSATFLSSSCFDFLLIEVVPLAYRLAHDVDGAKRDGVAGFGEGEGEGDGAVAKQGGGSVSTKAAGTVGTAGTGASTRGKGRMDEEEERDAVFYRLEMLGYRVGQGLVERYVLFLLCPSLPSAMRCRLTARARSFSRDRPRFADTMDVIKFLCKDLWMLLFRKQIDNLKTNHRGVYVLTDNSFRPFSRMSTEAGGQAVVRAQPVRLFLHLLGWAFGSDNMGEADRVGEEEEAAGSVN